MIRRVLLATLAAASLAAPASAQDAALPAQKTVQVTKIFRYYGTYLDVPGKERSRIKVEYYLQRDGKPAPGLHPALLDEGRRVPLPLNAAGRFERLPTLDQFRRRVMFTVDAPSDAKINGRPSIEAAARPAEEMDAQDLAIALRQVNGTVRSAVGVLSVMAPAFVRVEFPGSQGGVAVTGDGKTIPLPIGRGGVPEYWPSHQKGAVKLRFTKAPTRVLLMPERDAP